MSMRVARHVRGVEFAMQARGARRLLLRGVCVHACIYYASS